MSRKWTPTHVNCNHCTYKSVIAKAPKNNKCPNCGAALYNTKDLFVAATQKATNKASAKKAQKSFTLPKKLVGTSDPSDLFLGIRRDKL